jgi:LuxR family maltose regulon positive regulatory protein
MSQTTRLTVQTLGGFQVWRAVGGEGEIDAWGREKARALCQYLVTRRRVLTPKERIAFDLWPELDGERADRDFKVALNALLAALEPGRPPRADSQFVQRRGTAYGLVLERWDVDADRFTVHVDHAARVETSDPAAAIAFYRAAVALYRGDYLPDALYEDWSSAERERLLALYLSSASRLAELVLAEGQDQEAINLAHAVVARDPCWEEAYRVLMRAHVRRGNRPQAIRAYERLVRHLDEDLGLPPMPETRRLYEKVRAGTAI